MFLVAIKIEVYFKNEYYAMVSTPLLLFLWNFVTFTDNISFPISKYIFLLKETEKPNLTDYEVC